MLIRQGISKAFDTVDHIVLVKKLQLLGLPANMFN